MKKTIKYTIIISLCVLFSASAFSQKKDTFPQIVGKLGNSTSARLQLGGKLVGNTVIDTAKWMDAEQASRLFSFNITPSYDTVDVICLVSDTLVEKYSAATYSIKCKAVIERQQLIYYGDSGSGVYPSTIKEYILPKRFIVWQSVIIK